MHLAQIRSRLKKLFGRQTVTSRRDSGKPQNGPDFLCIGMQKAGTRWIYDQMSARRDVWMPPIKELGFFTDNCLTKGNLETIAQQSGEMPKFPQPGDDLRKQQFLRTFSTYNDHVGDLDWYKGLFDLKGNRISGDVSPEYSILPSEAVEKLAKELHGCRYILLLRDPVERLWSGLSMLVRRKQVTAEDLTDWDRLEPLVRQPRTAALSFPSKTWGTWSQSVPTDRIRYWFLEDIAARPADVINEICTFLGIETGPGGLPADFNPKGSKPKTQLPPHIRVRLTEYFAEEYEACARTFGGQATMWLDRTRQTEAH